MTRVIIVLLVTILAVSGSTVFAFQEREHLTPEEIELVKDAQILDKRIDVFIKAIDRRVLVLNGTSSPETTNAKQLKKDSETWGELPKGSHAELIGDIAGIFDEAITNIDDVSTRDENNPLIPKSLRKLSAAAARVVETLKPIAKSDDELTRFDQLTENAEQIIQAANKLPPPSEKEKKGKSKESHE